MLAGRGKSGLRKATPWVTPIDGRQQLGRTSGKVQQKANRQPARKRRKVRVKRRGKSSPPSRRREGHCKPGVEQAQDCGEGLPVPPEPQVERLSRQATAGPEKWSSTTKLRLSRPAPQFCNSCCSIGCPHMCELKKGHRGKHRMTGNCGTPENPVPYVLKWSGDFYKAWPYSN